MTATTKEKPGCLSVLFPLLKSPQKKPLSQPLPYRLRDDFLSPVEFSFFKVLSSLGGARLTIQTKVRLADVFFVARPNENMTYFSRIAQKHLDFLVCDSVTMKPLLGIELDDSSHRQSARQERDDFVDRVFEAAGLPLLRLPVRREYNTQDLAAKIAPLLKGRISPSTPRPQSEANQPGNVIPLCPKCGIPMTLRTVTQGEHKGKQFYGCTNYPRCREVKPGPA